MPILLMPDHGETIALDDGTSVPDVCKGIARIFDIDKRASLITLGTRSDSNSEVCNDQYVIHRDRRNSAVAEEIKLRVLSHVPYDDPLADPVPTLEDVVIPDPVDTSAMHPTLEVEFTRIIEVYPYHRACALAAIMAGDINLAMQHLGREQELEHLVKKAGAG